MSGRSPRRAERDASLRRRSTAARLRSAGATAITRPLHRAGSWEPHLLSRRRRWQPDSHRLIGDRGQVAGFVGRPEQVRSPTRFSSPKAPAELFVKTGEAPQQLTHLNPKAGANAMSPCRRRSNSAASTARRVRVSDAAARGASRAASIRRSS